VLLGLALGVVIAIVSHLVSAEEAGARRGITDYMMQRIPLQSLKIIIILWQILTQVRTANERCSLGAIMKTRSMSFIRVSLLILGIWWVWARIEPFDKPVGNNFIISLASSWGLGTIKHTMEGPYFRRRCCSQAIVLLLPLSGRVSRHYPARTSMPCFKRMQSSIHRSESTTC